MRSFVIIGGTFAAGLLVAPPRLVCGAVLVIASVWLIGTYRDTPVAREVRALFGDKT